MVTPHLPPDQAANALLPQLLADGLTERGHEVSRVAFEPRYRAASDGPEIVYIRRRGRGGWTKKLRLTQMATLVEVCQKAGGILRRADVVHVHSNTFMNQVAAWLAWAGGRPFVLTHYGTEIWHFRRRKPFDPFLWMNRKASHVTYYSRLLMERSLELGVSPKERSVVYPPVDVGFRAVTAAGRDEIRRSLNVESGPLLLNVKRLHPLAGQRYLIEAMPEIRRRFPGVQLWIAGEGESRKELEDAIAKCDLASTVRMLGVLEQRELPRYCAAADLFVLPSLLEAFPTVAAEALACGTPVISADHPGGRELRELFPGDVRVVPRRDPSRLATAILEGLSKPRRSSRETLVRIEKEFRPTATVERYLGLYRRAAAGGVAGGAGA